MAYDYLGCDNRRGFSQSMRRQKEPQARPGVARLGPRQLSSVSGDGGAVSPASRQFCTRLVHDGLGLRLREVGRALTPAEHSA